MLTKEWLAGGVRLTVRLSVGSHRAATPELVRSLGQ
jgi:hypothetical protein